MQMWFMPTFRKIISSTEMHMHEHQVAYSVVQMQFISYKRDSSGKKKCISLYWINSNQQQHECYFIPYSPNQAAIKNLDISWLLPRSKPVVSAPVSSLCYNKCTVLAMVRNVTVQLISSTVIWWSLSCLLHETGNPTLAEYGCSPYATGYYGSWQSQVLLTNISDRSKQRSTQAERFNIVKKAFSSKERKTLSSSFGNWKTKITLQKHITVFL